MAIVYRTAGAWGAGKGSNLTPAEVDENFYDHEGRIDSLETDPPVANGIANIVVSGATFTVVLDDATELGPYDIPVTTPRPTITTEAAATTLTPSLAQASAFFLCSHGAGCTVTIEDNATVAFVVDTELHFCQNGGFVLFIEGSTDVVIKYPVGKMGQTFGMNAVVTLKKVATDTWQAFGDLAEEVTA